MKCLVVVPAYNEEKYIAHVVRGILKEKMDLLVVDDGSFDFTYEIVKKLAVPCLRQNHMGKGAALVAGFGYAVKNGFDWVITMDGDGQHDSSELPLFWRALGDNATDLVIGSRMHDTSKMPIVRLLTNKVMSYIVSSFSDVRLSDTQCGFRAIKCDLLKRIKLTTSHYDMESELIIRAAKMGCTIRDIPVNSIYNDSQSSINKFTDTIRFFKLLWRIKRDG